MYYIPPPTWPRIAREARKMRKLAESLSDPKEKHEAEIKAYVLEKQAEEQKKKLDKQRC
jgi:hypothetical protein